MAENKNNSSDDKVKAEATTEAAETAAEVNEQAAEAASKDAAEPEAATDQPEPEAAPEAAEAEATPEAADASAAAAAPAPEVAPERPSKPKRPRRHIPRSERRQRPAKLRAVKPAKRGARKPLVRLPKPETERGSRQERRGVVVSAAMDKTIVVKVDTIKAHTKYRKVVRRSKKYHAHDEENAAKVGDVVRIVETRPLSATKSWRVVEIVEVAK